jgi:sigma-B regulation protein RsbU (phosphoserine phosphatase)
MGWAKRTILFWAWLFKSLLMKLSPPRRLALLAGLLLLSFGGINWQVGEVRFSIDVRIAGTILVLAVLMVELKDKLLAKDEIDVARQVQLALLPSRHPRVEGWSIWSYTRPANDVGGDLVDYLELDGGRLGVALGDVAGKGLGAALLMAKLQATLRATAPEARSLAELGGRLNAILLRDGLANRYATLFYFEIDPGSGRVRCLNAGHNPPLALRASGVEPLRAASPPVGMLASARFVEDTLDLAAGDVLIAYSDGLTEARNARDEEFGTDRLAGLAPSLRSLGVEQAGRRLLEEVDGFLGDARPYDDLSLVVLARSA